MPMNPHMREWTVATATWSEGRGLDRPRNGRRAILGPNAPDLSRHSFRVSRRSSGLGGPRRTERASGAFRGRFGAVRRSHSPRNVAPTSSRALGPRKEVLGRATTRRRSSVLRGEFPVQIALGAALKTVLTRTRKAARTGDSSAEHDDAGY